MKEFLDQLYYFMIQESFIAGNIILDLHALISICKLQKQIHSEISNK